VPGRYPFLKRIVSVYITIIKIAIFNSEINGFEIFIHVGGFSVVIVFQFRISVTIYFKSINKSLEK